MSRPHPRPEATPPAAPRATSRTGTAAEASAGFVLPVLALALGHMLSNALRTLPAIAADRIQLDLGLTAEGLSSLTGSYNIAFALGQIPVGVALDRFGVRPVSLALLAIVCAGTLIAALAGGPAGFLLAQIVLGLGCAGALIAPMTLAAKRMSPARFGLWSGLIQAVGNTGMLLSASPLAWLVEQEGWRAGFWAAPSLRPCFSGAAWPAPSRPRLRSRRPSSTCRCRRPSACPMPTVRCLRSPSSTPAAPSWTAPS